MKGLLSDTERKKVESIAYFHGQQRQQLQKFIGQSDWDDEAILDKLVKHIARQIGEQNGVLILDPARRVKFVDVVVSHRGTFESKKRTDDDAPTGPRMYEWFAFGRTTQHVRSK